MTNTMFDKPETETTDTSKTLVEHMKAVNSGTTYKEMALAQELENRQYEHPELIAHIVRTLG